MKRALAGGIVAAIVAVVVTWPTAQAGSEGSIRAPARSDAGFDAEVRKIKGHLRERVSGSSWRPGCPVALRNLRLIRADHINFQGDSERGSVIVHEDEVKEIVSVLRRLHRHRFPIRKMHLIDRYDASDRRSMAADNTSGFNCRFVAGTSRWSEHANGRAIDVNPIENPYVTASGYVSPPAGEPYADRSRDAKGMIHRGDGTYRAFRRVDWKWGGNWAWPKDYQHFSATGR